MPPRRRRVIRRFRFKDRYRYRRRRRFVNGDVFLPLQLHIVEVNARLEQNRKTGGAVK